MKPKQSKYRLNVLKKINELERQGIFDQDVEEDPPTIPIKPGTVDFLRKKTSSKVKATIANNLAKKFFNKLIKEENLIIKKVNGAKYLKSLKKTGFIITCNHFNPFDIFAVEKTFRDYRPRKKQKLYKIIREGNYTNFPGFYGLLMRNCNTLPLSDNYHVLSELFDAIEVILKKKNAILIYPEESMWWNYRKPKPLKNGAFNISYRNNVPVLPIFITMEDTDKIDNEGFPIQAYTINISKPIYPDSKLSKKENINKMKEENYKIWKDIYEKFYDTKLKY